MTAIKQPRKTLVVLISRLDRHEITRALEAAVARGVNVRALIAHTNSGANRDGRHAFLGSQSLRRLELEKRREIGVVVHDQRVVRQMIAVFEQDWADTARGRKEAKKAARAEKKGAAEPGRAIAAAS